MVTIARSKGEKRNVLQGWGYHTNRLWWVPLTDRPRPARKKHKNIKIIIIIINTLTKNRRDNKQRSKHRKSGEGGD